jgi:guanylate kinase
MSHITCHTYYIITFNIISRHTSHVTRHNHHHSGSESEDSIADRMKNAIDEMEWLEQPGNVDATVVNDDLEEAFTEIKKLVHAWYPEIFADESEQQEE